MRLLKLYNYHLIKSVRADCVYVGLDTAAAVPHHSSCTRTRPVPTDTPSVRRPMHAAKNGFSVSHELLPSTVNVCCRTRGAPGSYWSRKFAAFMMSVSLYVCLSRDARLASSQLLETTAADTSRSTASTLPPPQIGRLRKVFVINIRQLSVSVRVSRWTLGVRQPTHVGVDVFGK